MKLRIAMCLIVFAFAAWLQSDVQPGSQPSPMEAFANTQGARIIWFNEVAVSYTHLDVYKRQPQERKELIAILLQPLFELFCHLAPPGHVLDLPVESIHSGKMPP